MYKSFAKTASEAWRQRGNNDQARSEAGAGEVGPAGAGLISPKFAGMHAARCFLGALSVYEGSGWRAAEQYAYTVLPTEVRYAYCAVLVSHMEDYRIISRHVKYVLKVKLFTHKITSTYRFVRFAVHRIT